MNIESVRAARLQLIDLGDEKTAATLDWCLSTPAAADAPEWTFVKDALPPKNTEVLVAFDGIDLPSTGQYTGSVYDRNGWCYPSENYGTADDYSDPVVIAWMPLPAAPTPSKGEA